SPLVATSAAVAVAISLCAQFDLTTIRVGCTGRPFRCRPRGLNAVGFRETEAGAPPRELTRDATRLGRHRSRLRLHRVPVLRGEPRQSAVAGVARPGGRADLPGVACDLLHLLD